MNEITSGKGLHRLLYCCRFSRTFPRHAAGEDRAIAAIIDAAVRHNAEAGITGLLLAHQNQFLQVLEGPPHAVMTTYGRILRDSRQDDAKLIAAGPITERLFAEWSACARRLNSADDAILQILDIKGAIAMDALGPVKALALLTTVRDLQQRPAAPTSLAS
jgi:hypothetical protein